MVAWKDVEPNVNEYPAQSRIKTTQLIKRLKNHNTPNVDRIKIEILKSLDEEPFIRNTKRNRNGLGKRKDTGDLEDCINMPWPCA